MFARTQIMDLSVVNEAAAPFATICEDLRCQISIRKYSQFPQKNLTHPPKLSFVRQPSEFIQNCVV